MWNFILASYKWLQSESSVSSSDHENLQCLYLNLASPWKRSEARPPPLRVEQFSWRAWPSLKLIMEAIMKGSLRYSRCFLTTPVLLRWFSACSGAGSSFLSCSDLDAGVAVFVEGLIDEKGSRGAASESPGCNTGGVLVVFSWLRQLGFGFYSDSIFSHHPWIEGWMNTLFSSHSHRGL